MTRSTTVKQVILWGCLGALLILSAAGCNDASAISIVRTTDTVVKTTATATTTAPVSDKISISIIPSKTSVKAGEVFDIAVRVTSDQASRGAQFLVTWDPNKVSCNSSEIGKYYSEFAAANGGDLFALPSITPQADNTLGQFPKLGTNQKQYMLAMTGAMATGGKMLGPTGTGDIIVLHMTAKAGASGTVDFKLTNVKLGDATPNSDNLNPKVVNGQITITT